MAEITKDTFGLHDLIISSTGKWKKDVEFAETFLQYRSTTFPLLPCSTPRRTKIVHLCIGSNKVTNLNNTNKAFLRGIGILSTRMIMANRCNFSVVTIKNSEFSDCCCFSRWQNVWQRIGMSANWWNKDLTLYVHNRVRKQAGMNVCTTFSRAKITQ